VSCLNLKLEAMCAQHKPGSTRAQRLCADGLLLVVYGPSWPSCMGHYDNTRSDQGMTITRLPLAADHPGSGARVHTGKYSSFGLVAIGLSEYACLPAALASGPTSEALRQQQLLRSPEAQ
jgi:hypothetical protein